MNIPTPAHIAELESRRSAVDLEEVGGAGRPIDSGWMSCDIPDSWADHATSLGVDGPVDDSTLEELVEYYRSRDRTPKIKINPYQHPTLLAGLARRGFTLVEVESVFVHSLHQLPSLDPPPGVAFRAVDPNDAHDVLLFRDLQVAGFHSSGPVPEGVLPITERMARSTRCSFWIVEVDGQPAASGGLEFHEGSSVLISGCTLAEHRGRGLQSAFIRFRLAEAARLDMEYALLGSLAGHTTERNALRAGFQPCFSQMFLWQT
ncbi:MAG: hypothetical protein CBC35_02975 [Planctomycetes bacterium TMED75]|nr:hypothetical protein [Planctomycetaceae bacterium]OUU95088.1 MAG: hypothetical protein CBC35_02975 [Planctomycetes bacterium TMED75]